MLFEDFGVALPEELGNPLVSETTGTESSCISKLGTVKHEPALAGDRTPELWHDYEISWP